MAETWALIAATICALAVLPILWRTGRRATTGGGVDGGSVSRQWLIEHQTDERP